MLDKKDEGNKFRCLRKFKSKRLQRLSYET
jgi:hypothetical protein